MIKKTNKKKILDPSSVSVYLRLAAFMISALPTWLSMLAVSILSRIYPLYFLNFSIQSKIHLVYQTLPNYFCNLFWGEKKFVQFSTEPRYEKSFEFRIGIPHANTLARVSIRASNYEHNKKSRGLPIATSTMPWHAS